jgi:hypothetical protein
MTEEQPPVGRTWRRLYTYVLLFLAAQVLVFYAFTKAFE